MGEENQEVVVAEQPNVDQHQNDHIEEEKTVPLKALQAERRKRQEAEYQTKWLQEQLEAAQKRSPEESNDSEELLTRGDYAKMSQSQLQEFKRQTLEESFRSQHPEIEEAIQNDLPEILKKKPWLAHAIQNSPNRYQTAFEIIQDYKPRSQNVSKRLEENQNKPGSPAGIGKSGSVQKSVNQMSKKEFREYRASLRK